MAAKHPEDYALYQELLEATRDATGVENREEAVKLLAEALSARTSRIADFAEARARTVADGFDDSHKPETQNGQMALDIDTYLAIGASERVRIDLAMPQHTRQWIDIQNIAKAKHDAAHAAKTLHAYKLLAIQDEHQCSMWKAEQILRGDS